MSPRPLEHPGPFEPYDERDTVFARVRLRPGTEDYERYYEHRPELRDVDDRIRSLRGIAAPGTRMYRPGEAAVLEGAFAASDAIAEALERAEASGGPEGVVREGGDGPRHELDLEDTARLTRFVKDAALFLGADDVGIAPLDPGFVYTHRGRRSFGTPIDLDRHRHAVVLVEAMRHAYVLTAPEVTSTCEVGRVYQHVGSMCYALAEALRGLGVDARAHVDSNYLVICPPLAELAGLGEVGRNGVLVHRTHGPGVRIGVVTVDTRLDDDAPGCWGIAEFCRVCGKCADNCPSGSIMKGDPVEVRGALKWPIDPERCYRYWRSLGTDCGLCLRTCPFAKPDTALHRLVRAVIRSTSTLDRLMLRLDDVFYGAKPRVLTPPWLEVGAVERARKDGSTEV